MSEILNSKLSFIGLLMTLMVLAGCDGCGEKETTPSSFGRLTITIDDAPVKIEGQDFILSGDKYPYDDTLKVRPLTTGMHTLKVSPASTNVSITHAQSQLTPTKDGIYRIAFQEAKIATLIIKTESGKTLKVFATVSKPESREVTSIDESPESGSTSDGGQQTRKVDTINVQYKYDPNYKLIYIDGVPTYVKKEPDPIKKEPTSSTPPPIVHQGKYASALDLCNSSEYIPLNTSISITPKGLIDLLSFKIKCENDGPIAIALLKDGATVDSKTYNAYQGVQEIPVDDFERLHYDHRYILQITGDVKVSNQQGCSSKINDGQLSMSGNNSIITLKYSY